MREELRHCVTTRGPLSARELAAMLAVSERTAVVYIALLASSGELTIDRVSLPPKDEVKGRIDNRER